MRVRGCDTHVKPVYSSTVQVSMKAKVAFNVLIMCIHGDREIGCLTSRATKKSCRETTTYLLQARQ